MSEMRFAHWKDAVSDWWTARWPHFGPSELACSHCGQLVVDSEALTNLERVREIYGHPITIASGYRCPEHPIERGKLDGPGAHSRGTAFDPYGADPHALIGAIWQVQPLGFGMGLKNNRFHLHVDWDRALGARVWGY